MNNGRMNLLRTQNTHIAALKDIDSQKTDNKKISERSNR
jgi:hypothetical protein